MRSRRRAVHSLSLGVLEGSSGGVTQDVRAVALTAQEIECLKWCKEGKTNWEIGEILGISQKTVEFHVGNTMKKLGAGNRITAVIMGIKNGLISL